MSLETHTYETTTMQIASQVMLNPYFVLAFVAVVGIFMLIMVFAITPGLFFQQTFRRR